MFLIDKIIFNFNYDLTKKMVVFISPEDMNFNENLRISFKNKNNESTQVIFTYIEKS